MLETWVLIVFLKVGYGAGMTSIDGYESRKDCNAAAAAMRRQEENARTYCIPGPGTSGYR